MSLGQQNEIDIKSDDMNESKEKNISDGISGQRLNFIVALCAIFISAASFYATYLQADAAERQVKAMTLPLIQFTSGNWDSVQERQSIILSLQNAGIGPAIIKSVVFKYKKQKFINLRDYYKACCDEEFRNYKETSSNNMSEWKTEKGHYLTSSLQNNIILGQNKLTFVSLTLGEDTNDFWQKLNQERRKLSLEICYCSLLGECYITEKSGVIDDVEQCPQVNQKSN